MIDEKFYIKKQDFMASELAVLCDVEFMPKSPKIGNNFVDTKITNLSTLKYASENTVTFLSNPKYISDFNTTKAGLCVVDQKYVEKAAGKMNLLISKNAYATFARITQLFYPFELNHPYEIGTGKNYKIGKNCNIHPNVTIGDNAEIGDNVTICNGSYIGKSVQINDNSYIGPNASITYTIIGRNTIIHTGAKIGQDGFGYAHMAGNHIKIMQLGRVIIGDHVEIGANTCIDRGALTDTIIDNMTKIDNNVQIGHNVQIGKACIIVSMTGISGSSILEDYVTIGGQAGISGHIRIGRGAQIAAKSGVVRDIPAGSIYGGSPAVPINEWHRQVAVLNRLIKKEEK